MLRHLLAIVLGVAVLFGLAVPTAAALARGHYTYDRAIQTSAGALKSPSAARTFYVIGSGRAARAGAVLARPRSELVSRFAAEGADGGASGLSDLAKSCLNSFTAATPVTMADGREESISKVKVGDKVLATDPQTGKTEARPVVALIRHSGEHTMVDLTFSDGSVITATDRHPFWDATTGTFTDAIGLRAGDRVLSDDGQDLTVAATHSYDENLTAYNLEIGGIHTYYAGATPVLVHNSCSVPDDSDLGQILGRGARTTNDTRGLFQRLYENHGLDPHVASDRLHAIKEGIEGNPDVILTRSGGVYDATSGDYLGDLLQG